MKSFKSLLVILNAVRLLFHYMALNLSSNKKLIQEDIREWTNWKEIYGPKFYRFSYLMLWHKEFRNIFYMRVGRISILFKWICPPLSSLYINTSNISGGLKIQHGFATIIAAKKIGANAKIFQQVTIGFNGNGNPVLGDNVTVSCGAKVLGNISVGNNVIIGANAVVVKDVPDNVVVGGVPAQILKQYSE